MLEIEITESQATRDYHLLNPVLSKLINLGVNVSIDDFGTGYSSLSQLTNLVATTIKVDRQFVHDLTSPNRENALHVIWKEDDVQLPPANKTGLAKSLIALVAKQYNNKQSN